MKQMAHVPVSPYEFNEASQIACPGCGDTYVHFTGSLEFDPSDDADYGFDGCGMRGGGIRIGMWCECGHRFTFHVQHHKGQMFMFASDVRK